MTGTADISRRVFNTIAAEVERLDRVSGLAVTKITVRPIYEQPGKAVSVTFHILGYGTSWMIVELDGSISDREHLAEAEPFARSAP